MNTLNFYRMLLRCYPAAFREEYGSQMLLVFAEQMHEARQKGSWLKQFLLWVQAAADAATVAPQEHWHLIWQDLRYTLRAMAAKPGFAAVVIFSLALGIGANTAIFSLWNGILHSSLPVVHKPEELVILSNPGMAGGWHGNTSGDRDWLSYAEFEQLRDACTSFSGLMASQSGLAHLPVRFPGSGWEEAQERLVSGGFFQVLGVSPVVGRAFTAEDDRSALPHAVISYRYWQRRFGGRPDVLGTTITVSKTALAVIGVAPRGFVGETAGQQPDIWIPLRMQMGVVPSENWLQETPPDKIMWLHAFGRLKPGVTLAQANAEANTIFKSGLESFYGNVGDPERHRKLLDQRLKLRPGARGASEVRSDFSTSLTALLAAVGLLLLIACANLANLLLARGAARTPEFALRLSLGASRVRLLRQLLTESLVFAVLGGLAGLAVAYVVYGVLVRNMAEADRSFRMDFTLNPPVLCFTLAVIVTAAILFGLLPAWQAAKSDIDIALKEQSRGARGRIGGIQWSRPLVSLQLALSLPLLIGAGLLSRTLYNLQHVNFGYSPHGLLLVQTDFRQPGYDSHRRTNLLRELVEHLQQVPGVWAVTFSELGLFSGGNSSSTIEVESFTPKKESDRESALDRVGPNYFSALGIPLMQGREILEQDSASAPKVCVINEVFRRRYFAGRNPIGLHITSRGLGEAKSACQIVGVAQNARSERLRGEVDPRYFLAMQQDLSSASYPVFLIRTATEAAPLLNTVRQIFHRVDSALTLDPANTFEDQIAPLTAQDRTVTQLAIVFGVVALTLAAIGLYGVLSYGIASRTGEIAIRIALGAQPHRVVWMILRETSRVVLVGIMIGAAFTYAASHLIASRLFGIAPHDPLTLACAVVLLLLVAFAAAFLPAWRASKLAPMAALRRE